MSRLMKSIILAAGTGTRLRPYTDKVPKCMVRFAGKPLLSWQIAAFRLAGIEDITIVTGYKAEVIHEAFPGLTYRHNPDFAETNMLHSLYCAEDILRRGGETLIAYSDIIFEPKAVTALLTESAARERMTVASNIRWHDLWAARLEDPLSDAESFIVNADGYIEELGRKAADITLVQGQYMGLFTCNHEESLAMPALYESLDDSFLLEGRPKHKAFMTAWLQYRIDAGAKAKAIPIDGGWLEVDTTDDLEQYEEWSSRGILRHICDVSFGAG